MKRFKQLQEQVQNLAEASRPKKVILMTDMSQYEPMDFEELVKKTKGAKRGDPFFADLPIKIDGDFYWKRGSTLRYSGFSGGAHIFYTLNFDGKAYYIHEAHVGLDQVGVFTKVKKKESFDDVNAAVEKFESLK